MRGAKNLDVVLLETLKASFDSLEEETLEDITQVLRSGDVVGGWTEAATATRSVGRELDDEIERAAKLAPRARAQPKVHEEKVDVGKPPLASQVVAKAAPAAVGKQNPGRPQAGTAGSRRSAIDRGSGHRHHAVEHARTTARHR